MTQQRPVTHRLPVFAVAFAICLQAIPAMAGPAVSAFLPTKQTIDQPEGFNGLCGKYAWACAGSQPARLSDNAALKLAARVNRRVNGQVPQITDREQYQRDEYWSLPTARGGDCEDIVLLKKKLLVEAGVSPDRLLIATVLDHKQNRHAVLVLRSARGDFVLDSLDRRMLPWHETGYTFLRMQNPKAPRRWNAVFAGGLMHGTA